MSQKVNHLKGRKRAMQGQMDLVRYEWPSPVRRVHLLPRALQSL